MEGEKCKKGLGFGYKNRDYVLLWVKFCIRNIVLGVSRRKNPKIFPCGAFYSCVFKEVFIEVPQFHETSPSFTTHLEKVIRPHHCENFTRAYFLLTNKHQSTWKNYVLRTSPEDVLTSSGRPHLVSYVTPREAFAAVCPWDVLRTLF